MEAARPVNARPAADVLAMCGALVLKIPQLSISLGQQRLFLSCRQGGSLLASASCPAYALYPTVYYCKEKMKYSYGGLDLMNPVIEYQTK